MGMHIANHIVIYHGGYLTLQNSDKTGGARVTVHLPKVSKEQFLQTMENDRLETGLSE